MILTEVQTVVDELAAALNRPVGVDDAKLRSLAYSAHLDGADAVRVASILHREAPAEVRAWLIEDIRIHLAREPVRVPANAALEMTRRLCVPIRFERLLLGYLWLIDGEPALADRDVVRATAAAADVAEILYRSRLLENADRSREQTLLKELLLADQRTQRAAADQLHSGGFFRRAPGYRIAALVAVADERPVDERVRVRLATAAERARRLLSDRAALSVVLDDRIVLLFSDERGGVVDRLPELAAEALADVEQVRGVVGTGSSVSELGEASRSLWEANIAALVAARIGAAMCHWESLGSLQVLATVAPAPWTWAVLEPLLAPGNAELLETIACYLDRAGNSAHASADLHLHRTTLYHRLRQVERLCGVDLSSGDDRLRLHVALRLHTMFAREAGRGDGSRRERPPHLEVRRLNSSS